MKISDGFNLEPLVWLDVWTGKGDEAEKVELPDPVTVRRYTVGNKRVAEARLIQLVLSKVEVDEEIGELSVSIPYFNEALIPALCHFLMVAAPSPMVRLRRLCRLTDYSARSMGKLLSESRLDVRGALTAICRLLIGVEFRVGDSGFEWDVLMGALKPDDKKPNQRRDEVAEAEFYYGLMATFSGLTLDDIRAMTMWEIGRLCDVANRAGQKSKQPQGYDAIRRQMEY